MSRLVAYLRVSTDRQSEEGCSLEAQRAKIERWASAMGHELVAVYQDAGISGGKDEDERPGLAAALADLRSGRADGLVITKLDRLARSVKVLATLVDEVFRDQTLVSLTESVDTSTAMGRAFVHFCGIMAELERGLISERTKAALAYLKTQGIVPGPKPLGATPEEQATVARLRELREEGLTLADIAIQLTHEGCKTRKGGKWTAETVNRVLRRAA